MPGECAGYSGGDAGDSRDQDDQVVVNIEVMEKWHRHHGTDIAYKSLKIIVSVIIVV